MVDILVFDRDEDAVGVVKDLTVILARVTFDWSVHDGQKLLHILHEHPVEQPLIPNLQELCRLMTLLHVCLVSIKFGTEST